MVAELKADKSRFSQKLRILAECSLCEKSELRNEGLNGGDIIQKLTEVILNKCNETYFSTAVRNRAPKSVVESSEMESLHEDLKRLSQAVAEMARDHRDFKRDSVDNRVNKDHLKSVQKAVAEIEAQVANLQNTIEAGKVEGEKPYGKVVGMVQRLANEVSEVKNLTPKIDKNTAEQLNAKVKLEGTLSKFNVDIQRLTEQMFKFRDGLDSPKSVRKAVAEIETQVVNLQNAIKAEKVKGEKPYEKVAGMVQRLANEVSQVKNLTPKIDEIRAEQLNTKAKLESTLSKFNLDIQRLIAQMFKFRDGLNSMEGKHARIKGDLIRITQVLQSLTAADNHHKGVILDEKRFTDLNGVVDKLGKDVSYLRSVTFYNSQRINRIRPALPEMMIPSKRTPIRPPKSTNAVQIPGVSVQDPQRINRLRNPGYNNNNPLRAESRLIFRNPDFETLQRLIQVVDQLRNETANLKQTGDRMNSKAETDKKSFYESLRRLTGEVDAVKGDLGRLGNKLETMTSTHDLDDRHRKREIDELRRSLRDLVTLVEGFGREHVALKVDLRRGQQREAGAILKAVAGKVEKLTSSMRGAQLTGTLDSLIGIVDEMDRDLERVQKSGGKKADLEGLRKEVKDLVVKVNSLHNNSTSQGQGTGNSV